MNTKTRSFVIRAAAMVFATAIGPASPASLRAQKGAVHYEADLSWPKPLPNRWALGGLGGVCVDAQDHVLILNRQDVNDGDLNAARLAPPLIEFDPAGTVVNSWGDLNVLDPRLHSCHFDADGNVWIASAPSGMVQKYSHDGSKLLLTIGKKGVFDSSDGTVKGQPLNSNAAVFFMPSSIFVDRQNGEVFVSDGEGAGGNRRVAVMDRNGNFLRQWQPEGMETVHCLTVARDGLVYVCNRQGSRIQVYDKMGNLKNSINVPWTAVTPPADGKVRRVAAPSSRSISPRIPLSGRCSSSTRTTRRSKSSIVRAARRCQVSDVQAVSRASSISLTALRSIRRATSTLRRTAGSGFTNSDRWANGSERAEAVNIHERVRDELKNAQ